ncbi:MAG: hypothetical protein ACOC2U_05685 [bacterium]
MEKLVLTNNSINTIKKGLIEGLTIASGSKSSATYYHNKTEQLAAIRNSVESLYSLSKELPLIIASQKGVTGKFISEVLLNEFKKTQSGGACNIVNPIDWYDNGLSDKAILYALNNLNNESGFPYVLRLFMDLKKERVNNERTRKIILGFIWGQSNLEFYALKYRNKIAEILKHVYGVRKTSILLSITQKVLFFRDRNLFDSEKELNIINNSILKYFNGDMHKALSLLAFILKKDNNVNYNSTDFPLLSEYYKAKLDVFSTTKVPEEVLIGLISNENHPQNRTFWSTDSQKESTKAHLRKNVEVTSVNQQMRQTKSTEKLGVDKKVDTNKVTDFLALYKTGYENTFTPDILRAIDDLAEKKKINNFHYRNIGIILDQSNSMSGHKQESKNTPKAVADFTCKVLVKSSNNSKVVKTHGEVTDLASGFIELLKNEDNYNQFDGIFILTDGYENSYDGLLNEVLEIWKNETNRTTPIFQISPITSSEMGSNVRKLGKEVTTLAINNPMAIQPQINARLLEIDTKNWLENEILSLEKTNISRVNKISVNK